MPRIHVPDGPGDPEARVWALRPEMGAAAAALSQAVYERSILPVRERELARIRIAGINGCAICLKWRSTPGAAGAVSEAEYVAVATGEVPTTCSPREALVIDYATRFATDHESLDDSAFARLHAAFTDAEILDLTVCVGGWLALGRTLHVLGIDDYCPLAGPTQPS